MTYDSSIIKTRYDEDDDDDVDDVDDDDAFSGGV